MVRSHYNQNIAILSLYIDDDDDDDDDGDWPECFDRRRRSMSRTQVACWCKML